MKKFLSLVLALVMTMSLVTVSAGAKDFTDSEDLSGEAYAEAVNVMSEMGIIDGYAGGAFQPQGTLTRGAAAKIIACMMLGKTTAEALGTQAAPFKDVPVGSTFAGYIAYCVESGLIDGYADGTFRPSAQLTGFAFLKMLLTALGYDSAIEGFTGTNWTVNVASRAIEAGLTKGNENFVGTRAATREEACLYAVNALKATLVEYENKGTDVTVNGATVAIGASKPTYVTSNIHDAATSINDATDNVKNGWTVEFAEKYQPDLALKDTADDSWFFMRHGKRVFDRSRYQLDFRSEKVRAYADSVIDRLVKDYGVGYIKMDYNIEPGIGTEQNAENAGDGLLGHERAYTAWLDGVFARYPDLIIENCSSGGLRMDYAMLSRYSIQSTSDQDDYRKYCTIAANAPLALTPEQAAVWSYPMYGGDREQTVFNMINAMLLRIHQSGHLANIDEQSGALVKEGIAIYKKIRRDIKTALPFWSLGTSSFSDEWVSLGLRCEKCAYIAVWRRESAEDVAELPIKFLAGKNAEVSCIYPSFNEERFEWHKESGKLAVQLRNPCTARLFKITFAD